MKNKKPNLIIIGAMKSGTTSLHNYLNLHPEIYMSKKKETDFFSKYFESNIDKYLKNFNSEYKITGESSPNYSKYHLFDNVPERIYNSLGQGVKFIYILRDPVKRIISHYYEAQSQNRIEGSLDNFLEGNLEKNNIILTSLYFEQLSKFLEFYPINQIKIITFERLKENRIDTMNDIYNLLNLTPINDTKAYDYIFNLTIIKSKNILYKLVYSFSFLKDKINLFFNLKKYLKTLNFLNFFF